MNARSNSLSTQSYFESMVLNGLFIPAPPALLKTLCELDTSSEDVIDTLSQLVESNPLLESRFIQLSNSALYRGVIEITKTKPAIIRLGVSRVISMLIALSLSEYLNDAELESDNKTFRQHWQFACDVACIAYIIAEHKKICPPERGMVAGLLHNIGFLPILLALSRVPFLQKDPKLMDSVLREVLPVLTSYASRVTLSHWEITNEVSEAISNLDQSLLISDDETVLSKLLRLSVTLASSVECGVLNEIYLSDRAKQIIYAFWPDIDTARDELISLHPYILQLKEILTH